MTQEVSNKEVEKLKFKKLSQDAIIPSRAEDGSAGYDLFATETFVLPPKTRVLVKTNIAAEIPDGYYGRIAGKSGLAYKFGIDILGGVIDKSYRGDIGVILLNTDDAPFGVNKGKAIAQLIIEKCAYLPVEEVEELSSTDRGDGGYGSTGRC